MNLSTLFCLATEQQATVFWGGGGCFALRLVGVMWKMQDGAKFLGEAANVYCYL